MALGVIAVAAWLGEVVLVRGWAGIAWLQGFQWAALVGSLCAATAWLMGLTGQRPRLASLVMAWLGGLLAFAVGRNALYLLGSLAFMFSYGAGGAWIVGGWLLLALAVSSGCLWLAARRMGSHLDRRDVAVLVAAQILPLPLSWLTILVIPALNGARDGIHAIKMGYPVFWCVLLLYAAGRLARRRRGSRPPEAVVTKEG